MLQLLSCAESNLLPLVVRLRVPRTEAQILDTAGNLRYVTAADLPTEPAPDYTKRCATAHLYAFNGAYSGYTGLGAGFRSDVSVDGSISVSSKACRG